MSRGTPSPNSSFFPFFFLVFAHAETLIWACVGVFSAASWFTFAQLLSLPPGSHRVRLKQPRRGGLCQRTVKTSFFLNLIRCSTQQRGSFPRCGRESSLERWRCSTFNTWKFVANVSTDWSQPQLKNIHPQQLSPSFFSLQEDNWEHVEMKDAYICLDQSSACVIK